MTLNPGDSCNLTVQFSPTAPKSSRGTLMLPNNGNRNRQLAVRLGGEGVLGRLTRKPTSLDFRKVRVGSASAPLTVTLSNGNAVPIAINGVTISGKEAADFSPDASACGSSLGANSACAIATTFTPSTTGGRGATLAITTGGAPSQINVRLRGTGS